VFLKLSKLDVKASTLALSPFSPFGPVSPFGPIGPCIPGSPFSPLNTPATLSFS